jgi:hypothetical protein
MRTIVNIVACAILAAAQISAATAATGSNTGRINTMLWYEGHGGLLIRQEGMSDLGGCGRGDYFILDSGHEFFKEIYAMLLSAHLTDQQVQISIMDCAQGISRIRHVQVSRG